MIRARSFQCLGCKKTFALLPKQHAGPCPHCGSLYYKWLNYGEFALTAVLSGDSETGYALSHVRPRRPHDRP